MGTIILWNNKLLINRTSDEDYFKDYKIELSGIKSEIDKTAEKLWNKYQEIYRNKENNYDAKELFNKIKSDFLSYVISVPEKFYKEGKEGFNLIDNFMLKQYYELETGFKRTDKQEDYFF